MRVIPRTLTAACGAIALSLSLVGPARAASSEPSPAPPAISTATIDRELADLRVTEGQRVSLLKKLEMGIPWDSARGVDPVKTEYLVSGGFNVTRDRFADGSVVEYGIEIGMQATPAQLAEMVAEAAPFLKEEGTTLRGDSEISPMAVGIQFCTSGTSGGVFYASNCEVYYHGISWSSAFDANYQRWATGSAAQYIDSSAFTVAYALCLTSESVASINGGTGIRYSVNLAPACVGNIPFWLDLRVTSSSAGVYTGP